jgi:hypothetical protein
VRAALVVLCLVLATACSGSDDETPTTTTTAAPATSSTTASAAASDALPLGDGKVSTSPRKGYVYSCQTNFPSNAPGAFRDGPWIDPETKTWNPAEKIAVQGAVQHEDAGFTGRVAGDRQVLNGDGLPLTPTGVFPVASSDPAYQYDRNPNTIRGYTLQVSLPAEPEPAAQPTCVGGTIGVSVLGAPIFSAFDAGGRDAAAHEVQDRCDGHPERTGQYHFHSLSDCLAEVDTRFDEGLFGWALDGFGIYVEDGVTTDDLDECHGRTSEVTWHGRKASIYHYVATADFPYLVGCYRGTPITSATGLQIGRPGG